jgi:hypothetical protein
MIKIIIPVASVEEAVEVRDRIRGLILQGTDNAYIGDGGVVIATKFPLRVMQDLAADGFVEG